MCQAQAALIKQKGTLDEQTKLIEAQDGRIQGTKLALKLKNGYIYRLERRLKIEWPDQEKQLQGEIENFRKQFHVNSELIRSHILVSKLSKKVRNTSQRAVNSRLTDVPCRLKSSKMNVMRRRQRTA